MAPKNTLLPNRVAVVALGIYLVVALALIQALIAFDASAWGKIAWVFVPSATALVIYFGALRVLRVREVEQLWGMVWRGRGKWT